MVFIASVLSYQNCNISILVMVRTALKMILGTNFQSLIFNILSFWHLSLNTKIGQIISLRFLIWHYSGQNLRVVFKRGKFISDSIKEFTKNTNANAPTSTKSATHTLRSSNNKDTELTLRVFRTQQRITRVNC